MCLHAVHSSEDGTRVEGIAGLCIGNSCHEGSKGSFEPFLRTRVHVRLSRSDRIVEGSLHVCVHDFCLECFGSSQLLFVTCHECGEVDTIVSEGDIVVCCPVVTARHGLAETNRHRSVCHHSPNSIVPVLTCLETGGCTVQGTWHVDGSAIDAIGSTTVVVAVVSRTKTVVEDGFQRALCRVDIILGIELLGAICASRGSYRSIVIASTHAVVALTPHLIHAIRQTRDGLIHIKRAVPLLHTLVVIHTIVSRVVASPQGSLGIRTKIGIHDGKGRINRVVCRGISQIGYECLLSNQFPIALGGCRHGGRSRCLAYIRIVANKIDCRTVGGLHGESVLKSFHCGQQPRRIFR